MLKETEILNHQWLDKNLLLITTQVEDKEEPFLLEFNDVSSIHFY